MAVRSSLSISITAFGELWGLISCHFYGSKGLRISFLTRNICRIIGDTTSRSIERISYTSRLQMRTLINTVPTKQNPSGYITASSQDLLNLFQASFGFLVIRDETKMLGRVKEIETSHEVITILQDLRKKNISKITTSTKIEKDFPDLKYIPGFQLVAGILLVPLSSKGQDFIVFFRKSQTKEVNWAGNPHAKHTDGSLMPRTSFKTWSETVTGSKEWHEMELEAAAVLCLVYGKFIDVWRQKEAALRNSQITRVLLANSAHEVRTPLNAIINYLEIALEGDLDGETRDSLTRSYSASQSLIYVINDLLDLTASVEGGDLSQHDIFDLQSVMQQVTDWFAKDAQRKQISYEVTMHETPHLPKMVIGDARRLRQGVSNIIANAIENTATGGVRVDVATASVYGKKVEIEICISDTGPGIAPQKIDALSNELSQLGSKGEETEDDTTAVARKALTNRADGGEERVLGLGLAVAGRIVYNMRGQLRLSSQEGVGSRFVLSFLFDLPEPIQNRQAVDFASSAATAGSGNDEVDGLQSVIATPSNPEQEVILIGSDDRNVPQASSAGSKNSVTRLFEEMQKPSRVEGWSPPTEPTLNAISAREHTADANRFDEPNALIEDIQKTTLEPQRSPNQPGSVNIEGQGQALKASQILSGFDDLASETSTQMSSVEGEDIIGRQLSISSETPSAPREIKDSASEVSLPASSGKMRVLVAEDNPVNSRILEKRLKKLGHEVYLTNNGEECAFAYRQEKGFYDMILMDIQMPIMNGYESTKAIRSFEKSHPSEIVSRGRPSSPKCSVPILAVSASLVERERDYYIEVGFDGWIMKPILFDRLQHIMTGVTELDVRRKDLHEPGCWERGGWFKEAQEDLQCCRDGEER